MWSIKNYILPIGTIIVTSEIMRNVFVAQNTKATKFITFVIMVLIDISIYANVYDLNDFDTFVETIGFTLFASISTNLLYNYTTSRYGSLPIIIYRLLTVLYVYIIPYIPNVYIFFRCVLRTIYPYVIYLLLEYTFASKKIAVAYTNKKKVLVGKILVCSMAVGITMLVSCEFKYGLLMIGSGSMTGTINMGDGMIYETYDGKKNLEEGDIVMFNARGIKVVHRIIEKKVVNGQEQFITKGDANNTKDDGYITKSDVIGLYICRLPYAGYPSLWLRDIFSN